MSAASDMPLVTVVVIVFLASPTPIDREGAEPPANEAESDAAPTQDVIFETSLASSSTCWT